MHLTVNNLSTILQDDIPVGTAIRKLMFLMLTVNHGA